MDFLLQQERNFENTAKGSGYQAKMARIHLNEMKAKPMDQRLAEAREQMETFSLTA